MTATNITPGLDFEEWLTLRDRIIRLRRLGRAAMRDSRFRHAWKYYTAAKRAEKRMQVLERVEA